MQHFENYTWNGRYIAKIQNIIGRHQNYQIYRCFPKFPGENYSNQLEDKLGNDGYTTLLLGYFCWLINIWPGHLVFRQRRICFMELYTPNHFARQLGYDQLYVGNLNPHFHRDGKLFWGDVSMVSFCNGRDKDILHSFKSITIPFCIHIVLQLVSPCKYYCSGFSDE